MAGTGFINWDDYVNANQGALANTANALAAPVQQAGDRANASMGYAQQEFGRDVGANTLAFDPRRAAEAGSLRDYRYAGPGSIADNQNYQSGLMDAGRAQSGATALNNSYQRQGLLQQQFGAGSPSYDGNAARFDSALVGSAAGQRFQQLQQQFGGLMGTYGAAQKRSEDRAREATATTADAAHQYGANMDAAGNSILGGISNWANHQPTPVATQGGGTRAPPKPRKGWNPFDGWGSWG